MKPIAVLSAAFALGGLAACESIYPPDFGEAVQRNIELQVVNPEPPPVVAEPTGLDGHRAALAITRYRTDKVKSPEALRSTDVGSGGEEE
jgi:type IV pilus biogenesis protein CpaD/CtpE